MSSWQHLLSIFEANLPLPEILNDLVHSLRKYLKVEACSALIKDNSDIYYVEATTLAHLTPRSVHIHKKRDILGLAAEREEPIYIENSYQQNRPTILHSLTRSKLHSLFVVPLVYKNEMLGLIVIQNSGIANIDDNIQSSLVTICANVAETLYNELEEDVVEERFVEASPSAEMITLTGKSINPGAVIGEAISRYSISDLASIPDKKRQSEDEIEIFKDAVKKIKSQLVDLYETIELVASKEEADLFQAYTKLIESKSFYQAVIDKIDQGLWIQTAIKKVVLKQIADLDKMQGKYLQSRATDLLDLAKRILMQIEQKAPGKKNYPEATILVAQEVTASMIADVPKGRLKGIISKKGTENNHVAILAKAIGIPCIMGMRTLPAQYMENKSVIVDAYIGYVYVCPTSGVLNAYERLLAHEAELLTRVSQASDYPCVMKDDVKIDLKANVGLVADLDIAVKNCAEGVGLYRSEIPFMIRDKFPSESEQKIIYTQVLDAFPNDDVTMRTLDVGADKTLTYFHAQENNPALGWRGIRMMLDHKNLFLTQIRAMLKAGMKYNNIKILVPMVTHVDEVYETYALIKRAYEELQDEGYHLTFPQFGIMLEVPGLIYELVQIMEIVDFISVGTNDLAQYIFAVDRTNAKVSSLYGHLYPALLNSLNHIRSVTQRFDKEVSICGEMTSSPLASPLLVGLGFRSLSMNAVVLPKIKWILRHLSSAECENIAYKALQKRNKDQVHKLMSRFLVDHRLGALIGADKGYDG